MLGEAMGGDLQYAMSQASINHLSKIPLDNRSLRSGYVQGQGFFAIADTSLNGAEHARPDASRSQHLIDDVGGSSLSIGSRYADHGQVLESET